MNPVAWVLDALKVWPETVQLPESLHEATPQQLAEARSRLQQIGQVANELRKLIDQELAGVLQGGAMRYGDTFLRPNGRGSAKVTDPEAWWGFVSDVMNHLDSEGRAKLLAALYPAGAVRLTALKMLGDVIDFPEQAIRDTFIAYDLPTSPLSAMPMSKAPKWAQALSDGQLSNQRVET